MPGMVSKWRGKVRFALCSSSRACVGVLGAIQSVSVWNGALGMRSRVCGLFRREHVRRFAQMQFHSGDDAAVPVDAESAREASRGGRTYPSDEVGRLASASTVVPSAKRARFDERGQDRKQGECRSREDAVGQGGEGEEVEAADEDDESKEDEAEDEDEEDDEVQVGSRKRRRGYVRAEVACS